MRIWYNTTMSICQHPDCFHYERYKIGTCPLFTTRCQYTPMPAKPRKLREPATISSGRFICPDRYCIAYQGYCKGSCPYFDSELGCLHNR